MDSIKSYLGQRGVTPTLSFKDQKPHRLKFLSAEQSSINYQGNKIDGVKLHFEEDGEKVSNFTTSVGLLNQLRNVEEGDMVEIQMVKKNVGGQARTAFVVKRVENSTPNDNSVTKEDIAEIDKPSKDLMKGSEEQDKEARIKNYKTIFAQAKDLFGIQGSDQLKVALNKFAKIKVESLKESSLEELDRIIEKLNILQSHKTREPTDYDEAPEDIMERTERVFKGHLEK